jgi:solute carrier family 10 (sodium/bile acid cotransporter), member 7
MIRALIQQHWFLISLFGVLLFAVFYPQLAAPHGVLAPDISVHVAIALAFFVSGYTLPSALFRQAAGQWRLHIFIQTWCFVITPLLMFAVAWLAHSGGLPQTFHDGLLILACLPTTIASCVIYTRQAHGNEAGALCNSVGGNFIGLIISPLLIVFLLGRTGDMPLAAVLKQLSFEVIAPLIAGQLIRWWCGAPTWSGYRHVPSVLLLFIILCVFSATFITHMEPALIIGSVWLVIICLLTHALILFGVWWSGRWSIWKFSHPDRIAAFFCSSQKTMALGVPMVSILFAHDPQRAWLMMPLIIYHPLQLFIGGAMIGWWRK